jgi:hypothetical protein
MINQAFRGVESAPVLRCQVLLIRCHHHLRFSEVGLRLCSCSRAGSCPKSDPSRTLWASQTALEGHVQMRTPLAASILPPLAVLTQRLARIIRSAREPSIASWTSDVRGDTAGEGHGCLGCSHTVSSSSRPSLPLPLTLVQRPWLHPLHSPQLARHVLDPGVGRGPW